MFSETKNLPDDSRVWVYQSDRELTGIEEERISSLAKEFIQTWTAHSKELKAGFEIRHHIFLIIMIDEKQALASGCSIDKSIHFIHKIEKEFSLSLMDRQIFAFEENDNVRVVKRKEFEILVTNGKISNETIVFNNLIQTKEELKTNWKIPFGKSWHRQVI